MHRRTIDWTTVSVSRGAGGFDLAVDLDGEVSTDWQAVFTQLAEQDAIRTHNGGWGIVRLSGRTLTMERLEPESREYARVYLTGVVSRTNDAVAAKLDEEERERLRVEREEAERARVADELAAWFRSSPADTNGGLDPVRRDVSPAESDEAKDLRNRLSHPFGLGGE